MSNQLHLNDTRRWLPFLVELMLAIMISLLYIRRTFVNTVFLDGFFFVPLEGSFLKGDMLLTYLFSNFGEHLLVGYDLLSLFNAKFLALDMRLDPVMFVAAYAGTATIVYAECSRVFSSIRPFILGILFIPLGFLCFSLVAPPLIFMSTQFAWGSTVALMIAWFLQRDFSTSTASSPRPRWPIIGVLILIPLYYLVFSGSYFPGLIIGLGAMYVFRGILTGKWIERRIIIVAVEGAVCTLLYMYYIFVLHGAKGTASQGVLLYFKNPVETIMWYFSGIGAGLMDQHTLEAMPETGLILGGAMAVISVVAIWLFIRKGMCRKTYLPVYCMFYTVGIITSVCVGRGTFGDYLWMTNDWYSFHLRFFVIGVVWILLYVLVDALTPLSGPSEVP